MRLLYVLTFCAIVTFMDLKTWIADLIAPDSIRAASERIGVSHSTIPRQLERGKIHPTTIISLCRSYGRSPIDGLIETGYLYAHEVGAVDTPIAVALGQATNKQLLDEILRRSDPEARALFGVGSDDDVVGLAPEARIFNLDDTQRAPDHATIIAGINAGTEEYAAHEATEPLEENYT